MKVIIKRPGKDEEIAEVDGLSEINKICGNIDECGNGINRTTSDNHIPIGDGIELFMNEWAKIHIDLKKNLWAPGNSAMLFGNLVFVGYDWNREPRSAYSLTDEQVQTVFNFIASHRPSKRITH